MSDDLISRQAAIDAVRIDNLHEGIVAALQSVLRDLPSSQPERKKGRWINSYFRDVHFLRCSECGAYIEATFFANDYDIIFCPNCGARMDGDNDAAEGL